MDKAKEIREFSRVYFNKKKKMGELYRAGKEADAERVFLEMKRLSDSVKDLVEVGVLIKTENGWTTIESIQKGRISPVGFCCEDGHLYEGQAVLDIKK